MNSPLHLALKSIATILCLTLCVINHAGANTRIPASAHQSRFAASQSRGRRTAARRSKPRHPPRAANKFAPKRKPDVIFVPTPPETVNEMLRQAELKPGDVLYDLGSGDGRIPIAAAKQYGVRAVGIDIDPELVERATVNARQAGVADLVSFRQADLFRTGIREADAVTLYLSDSLNVRLLPKLLRELRSGARIISHDFRMGDWKPERSIKVPWLNLYRTVHVWTVPPRARRTTKALPRRLARRSHALPTLAVNLSCHSARLSRILAAHAIVCGK